MSIAEKSIIIAENVPKVYQAGYEKGKAEGGSGENPFYYATRLDNVFAGAVFPDGYDVIIKVKKAPENSSYTFHQAVGYKSTKFISEDNTNIISFNHSHRITAYTPTLETVDLTQYNTKFKLLNEAFRGQKKLKSILGAMDVSNCTNVTNAFFECDALEDIEFVPNTIKISIAFTYNGKLTNASKQSIFDGLATVETAQTLTLHANLKILQSQVDSANAKGWTVAGGTVVSEEEYYG